MRARVTRSCGVWKYCARRWIRFVYCSRSASPNTSSSTLPMPQSSAMWLRLPRRHSSSSSPGCVPPGGRARFARPGRRNRRQSAYGAGLIHSWRSPSGCGHGSRRNRGAHRANCSSGCRQSIPACIPTGSCEPASAVSRNGGERPLSNWYSALRRSTWTARTNVRLWRRWPTTALWICRCAWTTLARRPQLHRFHNNKHALSMREGALGISVPGSMRQREHLNEATAACWVAFSGEAIRPRIQIAAQQSTKTAISRCFHTAWTHCCHSLVSSRPKDAPAENESRPLLRHVIDGDGLTQPLQRQIIDLFQRRIVFNCDGNAPADEDLPVLRFHAESGREVGDRADRGVIHALGKADLPQ